MPSARARRRQQARTKRPGSDIGMQQAVARALQAAFHLENHGDHDGARQHYEQILRADPRQSEAHNRLGIMAGRAQNFPLAVQYFSDAVRIEPKNASFRSNLGIAHLKAHDLDSAMVHLQKAMALDSRSMEALYHLADCCSRLERPDDALEHVDQLLSAMPDHDRGQVLRATILVSLGRVDEAEEIFRDLIARGRKVASAYYGLSSIRSQREEPAELAQVEKLLKDGGLSRPQKLELCFAAGNFAADCGQYSRAFPHFIAGKGLYEEKFDIGAYADLVDGMIELMTPDFFAERRDFSSKSDRPVFIFGMPRSGTTLTEQIIGSHPRACPAGELPFFNIAMREFGFSSQRPARFLSTLATISRRDAKRLADGYLAVLRKQSGAAHRVINKMPHNFEHVWLLSLLFPDATFIHTRRDPMDTCVSCFTSVLDDAHTYTGTLSTLGRYYRLYEKLTRHWDQFAPVDILNSRYEALVADQDARSRELVSHTGLEWHDACLRHFEAVGSVRTLSTVQVRQPVYSSSIGRWKRYEAFLDELKVGLDTACG